MGFFIDLFPSYGVSLVSAKESEIGKRRTGSQRRKRLAKEDDSQQRRMTVGNGGEVGNGKVGNGKVGKGEVGRGKVGNGEIILAKGRMLQQKGLLDSNKALM